MADWAHAALHRLRRYEEGNSTERWKMMRLSLKFALFIILHEPLHAGEFATRRSLLEYLGIAPCINIWSIAIRFELARRR